MLVVENNNFEDSWKDRNEPFGLSSFALFISVLSSLMKVIKQGPR